MKSALSKRINFYSKVQDYHQFSNFEPALFMLQGREWPTVEHYFQAQKFGDQDYQEEIRSAKTPGKAKGLGRSRKYTLREDWEEVKESIMQEGVWAKFSQNKALKDLLLSTGQTYLAEHSRDKYWGDGLNDSGQNILGKILMKVRANLAKLPQEDAKQEEEMKKEES